MTTDFRKQAIADMGASNKPFIVYACADGWLELVAGIGLPKRVCGAMKKTGERCRSKELHRGGKCRFHGGLSTGARTPEGKARSIKAMRAGYSKWRAGQLRTGA